jgi:peptide chain release factor 2
MNSRDLKIEYLKDRKKGGQHVGIGSTGVKIIHKPTNLSETCDKYRSSHKNLIECKKKLKQEITKRGYEEE